MIIITWYCIKPNAFPIVRNKIKDLSELNGNIIRLHDTLLCIHVAYHRLLIQKLLQRFDQ